MQGVAVTSSQFAGNTQYKIGDSQDDGVFEWTRPYSMTQGRKGQQHDTFFLTEFQKLRLRKIRVRFHLNYGWLYPCRCVNGLKLLQTYVAQSDCTTFTAVYNVLHCPPGVEQRYAVVVNDIATFISWILLFSRLECEWSMAEIKVQVLHLEPLTTRLEGRSHAFGSMICIP